MDVEGVSSRARRLDAMVVAAVFEGKVLGVISVVVEIVTRAVDWAAVGVHSQRALEGVSRITVVAIKGIMLVVQSVRITQTLLLGRGRAMLPRVSLVERRRRTGGL